MPLLNISLKFLYLLKDKARFLRPVTVEEIKFYLRKFDFILQIFLQRSNK